jgi:DNA-binding response OmpR family regulator
MRVLIVEDEATLARTLAQNLTKRGHAVEIAGTAGDALASVATGAPDALVLDINLPDESGWEILRRLPEETRAGMRVIVMSAAPLSTKRLVEFRPARWFLKPFPLDALVRAVQGTPSEDAQEA